jgi:hypothetical protein
MLTPVDDFEIAAGETLSITGTILNGTSAEAQKNVNGAGWVTAGTDASVGGGTFDVEYESVVGDVGTFQVRVVGTGPGGSVVSTVVGGTVTAGAPSDVVLTSPLAAFEVRTGDVVHITGTSVGGTSVQAKRQRGAGAWVDIEAPDASPDAFDIQYTVLSADYGVLRFKATVTGDGGETDSSTITGAAVDTVGTVSEVEIDPPGGLLWVGDTYWLSTEAVDPDGIASVEFLYVGESTTLGTGDLYAPNAYAQTVEIDDSFGTGSKYLVARLTDNNGHVYYSDAVSVTVEYPG